MSDDPYVLALVVERYGYMRTLKPERALAVDAELQRLGWAVDANGELVQYSPPVKKAAEAASEKRPNSSPREKRA